MLYFVASQWNDVTELQIGVTWVMIIATLFRDEFVHFMSAVILMMPASLVFCMRTNQELAPKCQKKT